MDRREFLKWSIGAGATLLCHPRSLWGALAWQSNVVTSPTPHSGALALAISAPPPPDFWDLPRYKLTSAFRI